MIFSGSPTFRPFGRRKAFALNAGRLSCILRLPTDRTPNQWLAIVRGYTNKESVSAKVLVKGDYNVGSDCLEDGSIYIAHVVPMGTAVFFH